MENVLAPDSYKLTYDIEVIINVSSGAGADENTRVRLSDILSSTGFRARISLARNGAEMVKLARRAAFGTSPTVVAGGGDGTVNAVASALIGMDKTLGILPLGTLNHLAKDLHIPLDLEGALRTIIAGHTINIDVGEVNGCIFLNNSGLGLYPNIVGLRQRHQRLGYSKWLAFFRAAILVLRRYPFLHVNLSAGGQEITGKTPFVFVGNNQYEMESLNIGSRTCLNAGLLSVYMAQHTGRLGLLRLALSALFGRLREEKELIAFCTKEVWVKTRRKRVRVSMDGEIAVMNTPLHYRVRPGALSVFVPESLEQEAE